MRAMVSSQDFETTGEQVQTKGTVDNHNRLSEGPSPIIRPTDLIDLISDVDVVIFDCRFDLADPAAGESAFHNSRIPGAYYAHLDQDLSGPIGDGTAGRHPLPDPLLFAAFLESCGVNDDTFVIAYDSSGGAFASRLWWLIRWLGHDAVSVLDGGWPAWIKAGGLVDSSELSTPQAPQHYKSEALESTSSTGLTIQVHNDWLISADQLSNSSYRLIDSRIASRYLGLEEPIDPVAGHIPGAINRSWKENLDTQGHFLPSSDLNTRFKPVEGKQDVFYCGSGVTACHNILASVAAGNEMPLLYAPSWSGWISDPNRPFETDTSENPGS